MRIDIVQRTRDGVRPRHRPAVPVAQHRLGAQLPQEISRLGGEPRLHVAHEFEQRGMGLNRLTAAIRRRVRGIIRLLGAFFRKPLFPSLLCDRQIKNLPPAPRKSAFVDQRDERHGGIVRIAQRRVRIDVFKQFFRKRLPIFVCRFID